MNALHIHDASILFLFSIFRYTDHAPHLPSKMYRFHTIINSPRIFTTYHNFSSITLLFTSPVPFIWCHLSDWFNFYGQIMVFFVCTIFCTFRPPYDKSKPSHPLQFNLTMLPYILTSFGSHLASLYTLNYVATNIEKSCSTPTVKNVSISHHNQLPSNIYHLP
jgi:hypothetical protein